MYSDEDDDALDVASTKGGSQAVHQLPTSRSAPIPRAAQGHRATQTCGLAPGTVDVDYIFGWPVKVAHYTRIQTCQLLQERSHASILRTLRTPA